MQEKRGATSNLNIPLGARARSILKSLSEGGSAKEARGLARVQPRLDPSQQDDAQTTRLQRNDVVASEQGVVAQASENTVVPMPRRDLPGRPAVAPDVPVLAPARPRQKAKPQAKRSFIKVSALLAIALPTVLATIYFGFIAAPQYVAEARFAVRGAEEIGQPSRDLGSLAGLGGMLSNTISDSYIVSQFIESSQLVGSLQKSVDLREIYSSDKADFVAKYRPYDFQDTVEHLTTFWRSVSWVYFEPISGIITFTVRAFSPEEALRIARETVRESEKLVNRLSQRAREDAILHSQTDLAKAELRLKTARKEMQNYRNRRGETDPLVAASSRSELIAGLEKELAKQEADMAGRLAFLNKDSPSVRVLRQSADAIRSQIERERAKIGSTDANGGPNARAPISATIAEFEVMKTEEELALKGYEFARTQVEAARIKAERQSRYLATFVEPYLPEDSLYPARLQMILLVLVCSALAWATGVLVFYGIRDHTA